METRSYVSVSLAMKSYFNACQPSSLAVQTVPRVDEESQSWTKAWIPSPLFKHPSGSVSIHLVPQNTDRESKAEPCHELHPNQYIR